MGYFGGGGEEVVPFQYGDGSDGDLVINSDAAIGKPELNLESLTIDASKTWSLDNYNRDEWWPYAIIRCKTPIVLNGIINSILVKLFEVEKLSLN